MESTIALSSQRLPPGKRRQSIVDAYANGGLWGVANGLASTTLVTYLAKEYGATGIAISWLIAAPSIVGLLRLLTPHWLRKVTSRKIFCVGTCLASAIVLMALPLVSAPKVLPNERASIFALVSFWIGYRVFEYIGAVALWSWLGDLVPQAVRGHFVGRRQAWMNAGKVVGIALAAVGTQVWMNHCDDVNQPDQKWLAYAACSVASAVMVLVSLVPLLRMSELPMLVSSEDRSASLYSQLVVPFSDPDFRRLLRFGIWFSFSNGISQTARFVFLAYHLEIPFAVKKSLDASSRGTQSLMMPWIGQWIDRRGNVKVLTISQAIIAAAPLFFLLATPEAKWWILGAYLCWIAYAGQNVAQPNLMLTLSDPEEKPAYIAAYYAWCHLALSIGSLIGGVMFDWLKQGDNTSDVLGTGLDHFAIIFLSCVGHEVDRRLLGGQHSRMNRIKSTNLPQRRRTRHARLPDVLPGNRASRHCRDLRV